MSDRLFVGKCILRGFLKGLIVAVYIVELIFGWCAISDNLDLLLGALIGMAVVVGGAGAALLFLPRGTP